MAANWRSDWRNHYVDLTFESADEDSDDSQQPAVPLPASSRKSHDSAPRAHATYAQVPLPASTERSSSNHSNLPRQDLWDDIAPLSSSLPYLPSSATAADGIVGNGTPPASYSLMPSNQYEGANEGTHTEQSAKRRKINVPGDWTRQEGTSRLAQISKNVGATRPSKPGPAPAQHAEKNLSAGMLNKAPSVQYMNAALKSNPSITSLLDEVAGSGPRPIQIGRRTDDGGRDIQSLHLTSSAGDPSLGVELPNGKSSGSAGQNKQAGQVSSSHKAGNQVAEASLRWRVQDQSRKDLAGKVATGRSFIDHSDKIAHMVERRTSLTNDAADALDHLLERNHSAADPVPCSNSDWSNSEDKDDGHLSDAPEFEGSIIVDASESEDHVADASISSNSMSGKPSLVVKLSMPSWSTSAERMRATITQAPTVPLSVPRITTPQTPAAEQKARAKYTNQFSEEEEHLLIFLKEVKKLRWKDITSTFQRYYPSRAYHTLQSRYTTNINKRNRNEDPSTLKLPAEWAREATIDWASVRADWHQPRMAAGTGGLSRDASQVSKHPPTSIIPKPSLVRQPTENDYSSGGDSMHVSRPRRAPPVNYDVRKRFGRSGGDVDEMDLDDDNTEELPAIGNPARSSSPSRTRPAAPTQAHAVTNPPLQMNYDASDAAIALRCRDPSGDKLPYLGAAERLSLQNAPGSWKWNQLASRSWQGGLVHVDFSTVETAHVERALATATKHTQKTRHSTQRRQLRSMLKNLTEPQLLRLAHDLQRRLPARDKHSIAAFFRDARAGKLPESPQILRLSAARPQESMITSPPESIYAMLRQRELGLQSNRGRKAASRTLTYPIKNKVMDTLGPSFYWTGASSDIHTVAWSPFGEQFAAGAVAVTDQDSMQYNRPNNLLFGSLLEGEVHELAEHSITRQKTENGANSSHAMLASQDPRLYTTITSVAFSPCGQLMYSAGYDNYVCVWDLLHSKSTQPRLGPKWRHKAPVEIMVVDQRHAGVLATADKKAERPIKVIHFDEGCILANEPPTTCRFSSEKAESQPHLNILPQALRFEPRSGRLLLAGFGANVRNDGVLDVSGDLCAWDVETRSQMSIVGANRNVFDVAFNPDQRFMPSFAAGCVAGANANRGMRSVIRLYDEKIMDRYSCPLEIECRALDMNDVVWCPQDEHLIAAGCTDGCVYVWDLRKPDDPFRILSHGPSLMPLQEGVSHERTDTGIRFLSWGDNATRIYSGSSDGVVKVWDVTRSVEDTFIKDLITTDSGIMAGAFSPDFSKLLLGEVNGSVSVLEVGRDDCTSKDVDKLRLFPYNNRSLEVDNEHDSSSPGFGMAEGEDLLRNEELKVVPMGNLPVRQVLQGPNYAGPFDRSPDAPALRQQALDFQMSLTTTSGTPCDVPSCKDNLVKVTSEEFGDSGRSSDRLPDELRKQWLAVEITTGIVPGKAKCTHCGRPALPSVSNTNSDEVTLCERCCFACFRCGASNPIASATTHVICDSCGGVWEVGALGYDCIEQPAFRGTKLHVPPLRRFGRDILEDHTTGGTTYGDEMNALSDYYFSLAIDRPDSPPL